MQGQKFSEDLKKTVIQKYFNRGDRSVSSIAEEFGVSTYSLYQWIKSQGNISDMKKTKQKTNVKSAQQKMKTVMEFEVLLESERGEYLRKMGLHTSQIEQWKKQMESGFSSEGSEKSERSGDKKKIKDLEKELRRKDKALAETAALLILKKKADLIWGAGEGEE